MGRLQGAQQVPGELRDREQIDPEGVFPLFRRGFRDRIVRHHSRGMHQDIQTFQPQLNHRRRNAIRIGQVRHEALRARELRSHVVGGLRATADDQVVVVLQLSRNRQANASSAAGNQCNLAIHCSISFPLPFLVGAFSYCSCFSCCSCSRPRA